MASELATRLKTLREQKLDWTQRELADALGVTDKAVRDYEHDRTGIDNERLVKLGRLAGYPECWYWWELAGLPAREVVAAVQALARDKTIDRGIAARHSKPAAGARPPSTGAPTEEMRTEVRAELDRSLAELAETLTREEEPHEQRPQARRRPKLKSGAA